MTTAAPSHVAVLPDGTSQQLICPPCARLDTDPDEAEYVSLTSPEHVLVTRIQSGYCPACYHERLTEEPVELAGGAFTGGRCACCRGWWVTDGAGWVVLDQGRLERVVGEWWDAVQCAAHVRVSESRWRDLYTTGTAPRPDSRRDPVTGRLRWWAPSVRNYAATRPAQRTGPPMLPQVGGQPISRTVAHVARIIADEADTDMVPRVVIRAAWLAAHPEHARSVPPSAAERDRVAATDAEAGTYHSSTMASGERGTYAHKRVNTALLTLERAGAIRRDGERIRVADRDALAVAAGLYEPALADAERQGGRVISEAAGVELVSFVRWGAAGWRWTVRWPDGRTMEGRTNESGAGLFGRCGPGEPWSQSKGTLQFRLRHPESEPDSRRRVLRRYRRPEAQL